MAGAASLVRRSISSPVFAGDTRTRSPSPFLLLPLASSAAPCPAPRPARRRMRGSQGAGRHRACPESSTGHPGHGPRRRGTRALGAATGAEPTCRPSAARAVVAAACPVPGAGHSRRGERAQVAAAPTPPAMCMSQDSLGVPRSDHKLHNDIHNICW